MKNKIATVLTVMFGLFALFGLAVIAWLMSTDPSCRCR